MNNKLRSQCHRERFVVLSQRFQVSIKRCIRLFAFKPIPFFILVALRVALVACPVVLVGPTFIPVAPTFIPVASRLLHFLTFYPKK